VWSKARSVLSVLREMKDGLKDAIIAWFVIYVMRVRDWIGDTLNEILLHSEKDAAAIKEGGRFLLLGRRIFRIFRRVRNFFYHPIFDRDVPVYSISEFVHSETGEIDHISLSLFDDSVLVAVYDGDDIEDVAKRKAELGDWCMQPVKVTPYGAKLSRRRLFWVSLRYRNVFRLRAVLGRDKIGRMAFSGRELAASEKEIIRKEMLSVEASAEIVRYLARAESDQVWLGDGEFMQIKESISRHFWLDIPLRSVATPNYWLDYCGFRRFTSLFPTRALLFELIRLECLEGSGMPPYPLLSCAANVTGSDIGNLDRVIEGMDGLYQGQSIEPYPTTINEQRESVALLLSGFWSKGKALASAWESRHTPQGDDQKDTIISAKQGGVAADLLFYKKHLDATAGSVFEPLNDEAKQRVVERKQGEFLFDHLGLALHKMIKDQASIIAESLGKKEEERAIRRVMLCLLFFGVCFVDRAVLLLLLKERELRDVALFQALRQDPRSLPEGEAEKIAAQFRVVVSETLAVFNQFVIKRDLGAALLVDYAMRTRQGLVNSDVFDHRVLIDPMYAAPLLQAISLHFPLSSEMSLYNSNFLEGIDFAPLRPSWVGGHCEEVDQMFEVSFSLPYPLQLLVGLLSTSLERQAILTSGVDDNNPKTIEGRGAISRFLAHSLFRRLGLCGLHLWRNLDDLLAKHIANNAAQEEQDAEDVRLSFFYPLDLLEYLDSFDSRPTCAGKEGSLVQSENANHPVDKQETD